MTVPDTVETTDPAEVQRVVGPILACVERSCSAGRRVMFSSFDPDVCAALRAQQDRCAGQGRRAARGALPMAPLASIAAAIAHACCAVLRCARFPVVFLSGCGKYPHVDARRTSIDTAIQVASVLQLEGGGTQ